MMKGAVSLLWCALIASSGLAGVPLGRFLICPAERAELDKTRFGKTTGDAPARVEPPPSPPAGAASISYGGIVRRSDGQAMLWINGRLVDEHQALSGLNLRGHVRADGAVALHLPETGTAAEVRVGQSLDVRVGRIREGIELHASGRDARTAHEEPAGNRNERGEKIPGPAQP